MTTAMLTRSLDCEGCDHEHWTLPAGVLVTVHPLAGGRVAVAFDGRVYRADAGALAGAAGKTP